MLFLGGTEVNAHYCKILCFQRLRLYRKPPAEHAVFHLQHSRLQTGKEHFPLSSFPLPQAPGRIFLGLDPFLQLSERGFTLNPELVFVKPQLCLWGSLSSSGWDPRCVQLSRNLSCELCWGQTGAQEGQFGCALSSTALGGGRALAA